MSVNYIKPSFKIGTKRVVSVTTVQQVIPFFLSPNEAALQLFTILVRIKHTILLASRLIIYSFYRGKKLIQRIVFSHYSCI